MQPTFTLVCSILLGFYCLVASCTTVTEIPLPETPSQLVINGLFNPDSTWKINVSRSNDLYYYEFEPEYVENATVMLWQGDELLDTLRYAGRGNYRLNTYPMIGVPYRVRVEAPGFEAVEAEDSIPIQTPRVENLKWDFSRRVTLSDNQGVVFTSFPINFDLIDEQEQINRYLIQTAQIDSCDCLNRSNYPNLNRVKDGLTVSSFTNRFPLGEPVAREHNRLMFTNELLTDRVTAIEGYKDTSLVFHVNYVSSEGRDTIWAGEFMGIGYNDVSPMTYIRTYLDVWNLSEALYRYHLSFLTQAYNSGDPFAVHINTYSNTSNRFGIFAGYQRRWFLMYQRG